jgi:hypothetical protein
MEDPVTRSPSDDDDVWVDEARDEVPYFSELSPGSAGASPSRKDEAGDVERNDGPSVP